jgi:hypothetical protein
MVIYGGLSVAMSQFGMVSSGYKPRYKRLSAVSQHVSKNSPFQPPENIFA